MTVEKLISEIEEKLKSVKLPEQVIKEFVNGIRPVIEELSGKDIIDRAFELIKKSGKPFVEVSEGIYAVLAVAPPVVNKSELVKPTKNGRFKVTMLAVIDKKPVKLHVFTDSEDVAHELVESTTPVLLVGKYMIRELSKNKLHVLDLQAYKKL